MSKEISRELIESVNIEDFLKQNITKFEAVLPKHLTVKQLFRLSIIELNKNPQLKKCTASSLIGALLQCGQVGLEIGTGKAYLVPYKRKVNQGTQSNPRWIEFYECQFQVGYKGFIELALRSGKIAKISAHAVFENDHFYIEQGTNEKLEHRPCFKGPRGDFIGAYAVAKFANVAGGDVYQFDFMRADEIQAIKDRSKAQGASSPWNTDFYEMAKKTPTKRLAKYLPSSSELAEAIVIDDEADLDFNTTVYEHEEEPAKEKEKIKPPSKTDRLAQNMATQKAQTQVNIDNFEEESASPDYEPGKSPFDILEGLIKNAKNPKDIEMVNKRISNSVLTKEETATLLEHSAFRADELEQTAASTPARATA